MTENDLVTKTQTLIQDAFDVKQRQDSENQSILALFAEGFETVTPTGPRKISSLMLQQIMWKIMNKLKPLDFEMHGNGKPEWLEQLMTWGLATMADKSEFLRNLGVKQGVDWTTVLLGDSFTMFGSQENEEIPIINSMIPNSNLYVDQYATLMRTTKGRSATQALAIFSMDPSQGWRMFPSLKRDKVKGQIPREINRIANIETGRDFYQTYRIQSNILEIGYYFDIQDPKRPVMGIIAGDSCKVVGKFEKDQYPFMMDNQPYIPISQKMCMPSAEGFYNYGVGNLLFKLANVSRGLQNMALGHTEDSTYPLTLVNVPQGKASEFFQSLQEAAKGRAQGKKPIVPIEYDPANPNGNRIAAQSLVTNAAMAEFQMMYEMITREIQRCGISLDEPDVNPDATQYQILAEEEKSSAWVKQMQEYNAPEFKFVLEMMLDCSKKFIKKSNKSFIDMPTAIDIDGIKVKNGVFTMGAWADELRKGQWFLTVDSRSGSIPSNVAKQTRLQRVLALLQPGSPEAMKVIQEIAALNGRELSITPPQPMPGAPQEGQPVPAEGGPPPQSEVPTAQPAMGQQMSPQMLKMLTE
ncbi:MAG TPA: hypothetical protein PLQ98_00990 [Bacillota bacterium]|nr:hypothetical protein [Bacillota bacterium]